MVHKKPNKCVSKMHIQQTWGGGSYNYVQHHRPSPLFSLQGQDFRISIADCLPLSSVLKLLKLMAASNAGRRHRFWHAAHGCVAPYVDIIRGK